MLEVRGLSKVYGDDDRDIAAVTDVSLDVATGEFVAVCGRSGSGKSTLLAMLGGLTRPSRGAVRVGAVDVWSLPGARLADFRARQVGMVFQFASLLPTLRAVDNVALPALVKGMDVATAYAQAESLLAEVGLSDRLDAYAGQLSGGEQRRVALARALINAPPLLLADEPTSDLDAETEADILALLVAAHQRRGNTLVVVTHNLTIADQADRVVHLRQGRLVAASVPAVALAAAPLSAAGPVLERPAETVPSRPIRLGAGLGKFLVGFATWLTVVVLAALGLNYGTARYQGRQIEKRVEARQQLQDMALYQLRTDVAGISSEPNRAYRLVLTLQNVEPEKELHILAPTLRAYVQVDRGWEEVPLSAADGQEGRALSLTGKHSFAYIFTPALKSFEELVPGYMHVRFTGVVLVSRRANPDEALTERTDDFYVHLKPHDADDAAILRKTRFPGRPPLWIPMPPH